MITTINPEAISGWGCEHSSPSLEVPIRSDRHFYFVYDQECAHLRTDDPTYVVKYYLAQDGTSCHVAVGAEESFKFQDFLAVLVGRLYVPPEGIQVGYKI